MTASDLHLFVNPTAGRGRAGRRAARILELFAAKSLHPTVHESDGVGHLEQQVRAIAAAGATRLLVAGGDGSIHEAANGILGAGGEAALGVVPVGTGNDFAKAADIPLAWETATRLLADRLTNGVPARRIDAARMNGRYFVNGAGIGFDARVTMLARTYRWPIGDVVYLLAVLRAMLDGVATPELRITAGDFEFEGPMTLASVSNGPWIGGLFHIAPMADNTDGRLELLVVAPVTRLRILALLPRLMRGQHMDADEVTHRGLTHLKVTCDEPLPSHLDGEVQPLANRFEIEVLPRALALL